MNKPVKYMYWDEVCKIIGSCDNKTDRLFFLIAGMTGKRLTEVAHLKVEDIFPETSEILWHVAKKRGEFKIRKYCEPSVLEEIIDYIRRNNLPPESYLFPSPYIDNQPYSRRRWQYLFEKKVKDMGIKTADQSAPTLHSLRHSTAIHVEQATHDLPLVKKLLDHDNIATTSKYLDVGGEEYRAKIKGILRPELPAKAQE